MRIYFRMLSRCLGNGVVTATNTRMIPRCRAALRIYHSVRLCKPLGALRPVEFQKHYSSVNGSISPCKLDLLKTTPVAIISGVQNCSTFSELQYEKVCDETLESLTEEFEALIEREDAPLGCDCSYSSGVLTLHLGEYGTYVLNKQTPNKQIWLSSPTSGPKRYDFINNTWIYKHDGVALHDLINKELSQIFKDSLDFSECSYAKL